MTKEEHGYSIMLTATPIGVIYCVMYDGKPVEQFDTRAAAVAFIEETIGEPFEDDDE